MNINIKSFTFLLIIFVSSSSFSQYKYDIGLRASIYDMEVFQLETRFHLKSPYSIVVTLANGSRTSGYYSQTSVFNDSLINITNNHYNAMNNTLKIGVQRKLGFLATDVFYAGATLGVGFEKQRSSYYSVTYDVGDSNVTNPYLSEWVELSASEDFNKTSAINAQLALSIGMDVPITKRFSINVEIAFAGIYQKSFDYPMSFIYLQPSVSGGLRYLFGKRAE